MIRAEFVDDCVKIYENGKLLKLFTLDLEGDYPNWHGDLPIKLEAFSDYKIYKKHVGENLITNMLGDADRWLPIGGGVGYLVEEDLSDYDRKIESSYQLIDILVNGGISENEKVFVPGSYTVDLSEIKLKIPHGVKIFSDRGYNNSQGVLLFSNTFYPSTTPFIDDATITLSDNCRFSGFRMRGPSGEIGGNNYHQVGLSCGIRVLDGYCEIDNCELYNWNKWSIDVVNNVNVYIHHNDIHHTRRYGFGYGIWLRGAKGGIHPEPKFYTKIENNLLNDCRHEIGSGSQVSSAFIANGNMVISHEMSNHCFDRHGHGGDTIIANNVCFTKRAKFFNCGSFSRGDHSIIDQNYYSFPTGSEKAISRKVFQQMNYEEGINFGYDSWKKFTPVLQVKKNVELGLDFPFFTISVQSISSENIPVDSYIWYCDDGNNETYGEGSLAIENDHKGCRVIGVRCRNKAGFLSDLRTIILSNSGEECLVGHWDFRKSLSNSFEDNFKINSPLFLMDEQGISLDGSNYLLANNPKLNNCLFVYENPTTYIIKCKITGDRTYAGIIGYGAKSSSVAGFLLTSKGNGLFLRVTDGRKSYQVFTGPNTVSYEGWVNIGLTIDPGNVARIFANGEFLKSLSLKGMDYPIYNTVWDFEIAPKLSRRMSGIVQKFSCYKSILSDQEILDLMN